jgi:hypothetical protein
MAKRTPPEIGEGAVTFAVRYNGDGTAFISGVPIRNLTADEWSALSDELRALCLESGLYSLEN